MKGVIRCDAVSFLSISSRVLHLRSSSQPRTIRDLDCIRSINKNVHVLINDITRSLRRESQRRICLRKVTFGCNFVSGMGSLHGKVRRRSRQARLQNVQDASAVRLQQSARHRRTDGSAQVQRHQPLPRLPPPTLR